MTAARVRGRPDHGGQPGRGPGRAATWAAAELAGTRGSSSCRFVDSVAGVDILAAARRRHGRSGCWPSSGTTAGGPGAGRWTSCWRWPRHVQADRRGRAGGVAGYEGALKSARRGPEISVSAAGGASSTCGSRTPILTVGGSQWFDVIGRELVATQARIVLRSGAYVTHDDGYYRERTPFNRVDGELRPALEVWAHVLSTPEPGLAIVGMGKRDAPYDEGLPVPQARRRHGRQDAGPAHGRARRRAPAGGPAGLRHLPPVHRLRQVAVAAAGRRGIIASSAR